MSRLENLPVEIVDRIFSQLCHHCNNKYPETPTSDHGRDNEALFQLTRTSRTCRSIALPFLFHSFYHYQEVTYIFKMFNWHQDFTQCTRALVLPFSSTCSDIPLVRGTAERLSLADPKAVDFVDLKPFDFAAISNHPSAEASLALTLCSKVKRLQITLDTLDRNRASFKDTFHLFKRISGQRGTPAVLQSLKHLEVRTGFEPTDGIVASGIPLLLELSPRLEVLILRDRGGFKPRCVEKCFFADRVRPALESLVEIQMIGWDLTRRNTDNLVLGEFLNATKRLKRFKYLSSVKNADFPSDWELGLLHHEYPPRHLINMLLRVQSSLQHLTLDFGERGLTLCSTSLHLEGIIIDCQINAGAVTAVYGPNRIVSTMKLVDDVERDLTNHRFRIEEAFMGSSVVVKYRFWVKDKVEEWW
ncbi:f-box domain protein [Fusarium flagelliforme]|uniref:F-box domain protein n=1 Tax=Fusarium flagelliforme TaxID=2675880 RepID=A0A395MC97_9HYPO|nr:f-box domain protein [Fusarium flagelliforme]